MNRKRTWVPRLVLLLLISMAVGVPVIAWQLERRAHSITLHARMAEAGGWAPANLAAEVGVPLKLRLTSDYVVHSFAIGQSDAPAVVVIPGEFTETPWFDKPGSAYYCARWCGSTTGACGVRSRSAGLMAGAETPSALSALPDIDAPHPPVPSPAECLSCHRRNLPVDLARKNNDPSIFAHSPAEIAGQCSEPF
jgi:hypothetical protein